MNRVEYDLRDSIATLKLDDGKVNVMSPDMLAEIHAALDRAESDNAVVILTGRDGRFSAGFDAGDHRIGTTDAAKFTANEVAIGLTMPRAALVLLRQRLTPAAFVRAAMLAEVFTPAGAVEAGFLDQVVPPEALSRTARDVANRLALLDPVAHSATKLRARVDLLADLRAAIVADATELAELADRP